MSKKETRSSLSISIYGIINWFKDRRIKKDLDNIKFYEDMILENPDRRDENGQETETKR